MFEIKNVTKQYAGETALHHVTLTIGEGLTYIVGSSGSGKTTLLKVISGMEQEFEGEVSYNGKSIKSLSPKEKGYFYNHIFGFVWQSFNLLEDNTVLENVVLPQYLSKQQNLKLAKRILRDLRISDIADQKVKYLSGGQKQRVAIARELMKDPQVIFADEPTSALDEKTAKITMDILRSIAKNRTVIVVTHDTSLVAKNDQIYELDKGELLSSMDTASCIKKELTMQGSHRLSLYHAYLLAKKNIKHKVGRYIIATISLVIASVLLLTTLGGGITGNSQDEFQKLFETYGDSLTDISIYDSFTDASGTGGGDSDKPSGDVNQNISGLYEVYAKDDRISFVTYLQAFDNISITVDGAKHRVQSSGNMPSINKVVAGTMPMGNGKEVVVPVSFVKNLGTSFDEILGKEIEFKGSIVDWSTGSPVWKDTHSKLKIVGVIDTTIKFEAGGKIGEYVLDDAFLFSKTALEDMRKQAGVSADKMNFLMRAKTPADMIAIKDEFNKKGIVPLGNFELVEDMVRLNNQTTEQSTSASFVITALSIIMVIVIYLITGAMRKKEFAIYKVSGFTVQHLCILQLAEILLITMSAIALLLLSSPLLSTITKALFGISITHVNTLLMGALLIVATAVVAYLSSLLTLTKVSVSTALKAGDR